MLPYFKLASRNIFRFKRRTFITFFATSVGLALLVLTISLMNGIDRDSISNIINCQTSHIKIFKTGYFAERKDFPLETFIENPKQYYGELLKIPAVKAVESRILFAATLIREGNEIPCTGVAVEPETDPQIFNISDSMLSGTWLKKNDSGVLVGKDMAEDMGIRTGDWVTLRMIYSTKKEDFNWNALDAEVKGIFESGNPTVDSSRVFVSLHTARAGLEMRNRSTEIVLRLNSSEDAVVESVKKQIKDMFLLADIDMEAWSWKELASSFLEISKMKTRGSGVIIFIMLLIASVGIVNTMLMSVLERTREIGMLSAMGMKKREISGLFVLEGGLIGTIGSFLGCLMGGLLSWYLEVHGFSMSAVGESWSRMSESVYPVKDVFYAELSFQVLFMVFVFGVVISLIASAYPARKAAGMDPVQALRHL